MSEWNPKANEIFLQAVDCKSSESQQAYLDEACGYDENLRAEVESLLTADLNAPSILDLAPAPVTIDRAVTLELGSQIGPYKIREQLAEGGMGVVYVAEQKQPVRRKVALKLIKPGMATKDVVARFEAERQALAMMDHPNIARVFDGGETDAGQPYFVMELVLGIPITEFCDQQKLATRERLQLLLKVCRAVQHAHQRGVIHRDIKPSNVIVAEIDDAAVPKVIDFGVAKALNHKLSDQTIYTHVSQMIGTPLYMSPEQSAMGVVDVDTRSDVYSLGVLLYELLTGRTPFDRESLQQVGFDEMRRIIREEEPSLPSALVSTLQGQVLSTVADRRRTDSRKLGHLLRGELDWITLKAIEKDRDRRYESASALAADLERYLDDQPVAASPPSASYKLRKYVRRHKAQLLTFAVIAVVLIGASLVSSALAAWAVREQGLAEQERGEAVTQYQRAEDNLDLSLQVLDEVYFQLLETRLTEKPELDERDERFLERALPLYQQLAKQKGDDPQSQEATTRAYLRVGNIQNDLERYEQAEHALRESVEAAHRLVAAFPSAPEYEKLLIEGQLQLAHTARYSGQPDEAERIYGDALERSRRLSDQYPRHGDYRRQLARGCGALADLLNVRARPEEAVTQYQRSIELYRDLVESFSETRSYQQGLSTALSLFGDLLTKMGREEEAEELERIYAEVQDGGGLFQAGAAGDPEDERALADSRRLLAWRLQSNKQYKKAEKVCREALEMQNSLVTENPHAPGHRYAKARTLTNLGNILKKLANFQEAEQQFTQAIDSLEMLTEWWPGKRPYREELATAYSFYGDLLARTERLEEAETAYRRQIALRTELAAQALAADPDAYVEAPVDSQLILGDLLKAAGHDRAATQQWRQALAHIPETYVDFKVRINTPGLYRLHLRGGGRTSRDDSVYVRIIELWDGPSGPVCDWYFLSSKVATSSWPGNGGFERTNNANDEPAVWKINESGDYTIRFSNHDNRVALDAFVLQKASLAAPSGDGPVESLVTEDGVFLESDGRVVVEAEHFASREPGRRATNGSYLRQWVVVPGEGKGDPPWSNFRGEGYIQLKRNEEVSGGSGPRWARAPLPEKTLVSWDLERYTRLIEARPDDDQSYLLRAKAYENLEQSEEAQADNRRALGLLAAAVEQDPENPEPYRRRANHFFDLKDYENAAKDYAKLVELLPDDAVPWFRLGYSYEKRQLRDKAIEAYTESIRLDPNPKRFVAYNNRGIHYAKTGQLNKAIDDHTEAIRIDPQRSIAYNNRGATYSQKGELDKAINDLDEAIRLDPTRTSAYENRGATYGQKGELDKAIDDLDEAIRLDPTRTSAYENRGHAYREKGELSKAIDDLDEAIRLDPTRTSAYENRGATYGQKGELDKAINDLDEAIRLDPTRTSAYENRGHAYREKGELSKAIDDLDETIRLDPTRASAYLVRGLSYQQKGEVDKAIADLTEAIRIDPKDSKSYNGLAWILVTGPDPSFWNPPRAVTLATKAVELDPDERSCLHTLGVAQYRAGQLEKAISTLNTSMSLSAGGDSNDWFFLAMAHQRLAEQSRARTWYDKAVAWMQEHDPEDSQLVRFQEEAAKLLGVDESTVNGQSADARDASDPKAAPAVEAKRGVDEPLRRKVGNEQP